MAKKTIPAWQQVLLVALESVPEHDNGADAWQRLNPAEQAAIMDYLAAHCGDEAQAKLDETCAKIKHPKWWMMCWVIMSLVALMVIGLLLMTWLEEVRGARVVPFLWLVLCPLKMYSAWQGDPRGKAQQAWEKQEETYEGTTRALNDMHRLYTLPRAERMDKGYFIFYLVGELVWIGLLIWVSLK